MTPKIIQRFKLGYVPNTYSAKIQRAVLNKVWARGKSVSVEIQGQRVLRRFRRRLRQIEAYWSVKRGEPIFSKTFPSAPPKSSP